MKRLFYIVLALFAFISADMYAQAPSRRKAMLEKKQEEAGRELSVRAQSQFSPSVDMPVDIKWKRDIYRIIDLEKEENTALYFPERPIGDKMNLFSLIFKLAVENKIKIYEYNIDGNELFTDDNIISPKDMLDRFNIYYRRKLVNRKDTVFVIDDSDIPSNEAKSYFVKEVNYFDDRSSTMNSMIEALCPVLHRTDEFTYEMTKYPMFWVKYKDIEPYLSRTLVMTSDYNNATSVTVADFFSSKMYKGDIYKTTNRLNRTLAQYCPNDSTLKAEQERIEGQLKAFEEGLWKIDKKEPDTTAVAKDAESEKTEKVSDEKPENSKRIGRDNQGEERTEVKKESRKRENKVKSSSSVKSRPSAAPRASVRRERR